MPTLLDQLKQAAVGTPGRFEQISTFSEPQKQAMNQVLNYALPQLTQNKFNFEPIAEYARKNFNERQLPALQERFVGARGSSGYRNAIAGAGADLEAQLAAQQQGYNLQQQSQLQNLLGIGLTPQFETAHFGAEPGALQAAAPYLGQAVGQAIPQVIGAGANALGSIVSGAAGRLFGGGGGAQQAAQVPSTGVQALQGAATGAGTGAATALGGTGIAKAAAVLGPTAAKAAAGLTPFGAWFLPIAAGVALLAGGYFAYDALKRRWEKKRDLNPEEQRLAQQINSANPQQQVAAGIVPLQGAGSQAQGAPQGPGVQAIAQAPQVVCRNGVCNVQRGPVPSNYDQQRALGYIR